MPHCLQATQVTDVPQEASSSGLHEDEQVSGNLAVAALRSALGHTCLRLPRLCLAHPSITTVKWETGLAREPRLRIHTLDSILCPLLQLGRAQRQSKLRHEATANILTQAALQHAAALEGRAALEREAALEGGAAPEGGAARTLHEKVVSCVERAKICGMHALGTHARNIYFSFFVSPDHLNVARWAKVVEACIKWLTFCGHCQSQLLLDHTVAA